VYLLAVDISRVKMSVRSSEASSVGVEWAGFISVTDKRRLVTALAIARRISIVFFDEVAGVAAVLDVCWVRIVLVFERSISHSIVAAISFTVTEAVLEEVLTVASDRLDAFFRNRFGSAATLDLVVLLTCDKPVNSDFNSADLGIKRAWEKILVAWVIVETVSVTDSDSFIARVDCRRALVAGNGSLGSERVASVNIACLLASLIFVASKIPVVARSVSVRECRAAFVVFFKLVESFCMPGSGREARGVGVDRAVDEESLVRDIWLLAFFSRSTDDSAKLIFCVCARMAFEVSTVTSVKQRHDVIRFVSVVALLSSAVRQAILPLHHARFADSTWFVWWRSFRRTSAIHADELLALEIPVDEHFSSALARLALNEHVVSWIVKASAVALTVNIAEVIKSDLTLVTLEAVVGIGWWSVDGVNVAVCSCACFFDGIEVVASRESTTHVLGIVVLVKFEARATLVDFLQILAVVCVAVAASVAC